MVVASRQCHQNYCRQIKEYPDPSFGLCRGKDIIKYAELRKFPIIPCNLCGSQENLQRAIINDMLREWDKQHPKRLHSIFGALQNVSPSQLADRELFDFEALDGQREFDMKDPEDMKKRLDVVNLSFAAE